jgi:UDP-N-acetyl-D-galactosamine dehydrogenase
VRELRSFGVEVQVHDPLALASEVMDDYGIELMSPDGMAPADAVVLAAR